MYTYVYKYICTYIYEYIDEYLFITTDTHVNQNETEKCVLKCDFCKMNIAPIFFLNIPECGYIQEHSHSPQLWNFSRGSVS